MRYSYRQTRIVPQIGVCSLLIAGVSWSAAVWFTAPSLVGQQTGIATADSYAESEDRPKFLRVTEDDRGQLIAMQTAIVRYRVNAEPYQDAQVDLIGAVHIAHQEYFEKLNETFRSYDALLYELVADPEVNVPDPEAAEQGRGIIGSVQVQLKDTLGLEFQLDHIDYDAKNFVHADMSPGEFIDDMERRGDGFASMFARMLGAGIAAQSSQSNSLGQQFEILTAMLSNNPQLRMRRAMAKQFESMELQLSGLEDQSGRSTLVTERNRKAFEVLRSELKAGKRKLGIFYGAAHLDDMHEKMVHEYMATVESTKWLDAWKLKE